jgi:hypothetical protein
MRWWDLVASLVFLGFAGVQINDPDSLPWILIYGGTGLLSLAAFFGHVSPIVLNFWLLSCLAPAIPLLADLASAPLSSFSSFGMADLRAERARESVGLLLAAGWTTCLLRGKPIQRTGTRSHVLVLLLTSCSLTSCTLATVSMPHAPPTPVVRIPTDVPQTIHERKNLLRRIDNPRGTLLEPRGTLLVAVAGSGHRQADGSIRRFHPGPDGNYRAPTILIANQASKNLLPLVRRDEVFGVAAIKAGEGQIRATAAYYDGPSRILAINNDKTQWVSAVSGNLNDIAWHPVERVWFGVSSSTNELLRIPENEPPVTVTSFPPLENGQEAVPGYLRHDPQTDDLLVSLFSGSPLGETGGDGTEIVTRAGKIVRVNPRTGKIVEMVSDLTAPTDLEISADGRTLWILELCDSFVGPVTSRAKMLTTETHGGFRRFSGRLLQVDRTTGSVVEIAHQLDTPTNLSAMDGWLLISTGMGTPGRDIPGLGGITQPLEGRIDAIRIARQSHSPENRCRSTNILRRRFQHRSLMGR